MASVNQVNLIGNVGQDPEIKYLSNGDAVCNISLATTESWKDKNSGERNEKTSWHRVVLFRKLAELVGEYVRKGHPLYISGRIEYRKWTDKQGVERESAEIVAEKMQLLASKEGGGSVTIPASKKGGSSMGDMDEYSSDIPF